MNKFIFCAPSGAGKTSIILGLLKIFKNLVFSKSFTTREMRPGEKEGEEYFFVSKEIFEKMKKNDEFIETEEIFGNQYGTPKFYMEMENPVIFNLDIRGYRSLKNMYPAVISIFILPPSMKELQNRLIKRGEKNLEIRIKNAITEMLYAKEFDFIIFNENLEEAIKKVENIIYSYFEKKKCLDFIKNMN